MQKCAIKFLTFVLILVGVFFHDAQAQSLQQTDNKAYLRWTLPTAKDQLAISTDTQVLSFKSLNKDAVESVYNELRKLNLNNNYFESYVYEAPKTPGNPHVLNVFLKDKSVEVFEFYQDELKRYVVDFWINQDLVAKKAASIQKKMARPIETVTAKAPEVKKETPKVQIPLAPVKKEVVEAPSKYRDFRYGAAFIWNYEAMIPELERDINTAIKAPIFFYKVSNRTLLSDAKEEHLQLSINFFNKKEWGLMTRSIDLYEKKYGRDGNYDTNNYMKANSLILDNIDKQNKGVKASAINLLENIVEKTKNFDMKMASLRYIVQYALDHKDYIKSLEMAKKMYVEASEKFEDDLARRSINTILYSLAKLKQEDKISEFLKNQTVMRLTPPQVGVSYLTYVDLANNKEEEVIKRYETNKNSLVKPIEPALLYNTAEAYFRTAQYAKAQELFDSFVKDNSEVNKASEARLRLALSYDLLDKDPEESFLLYKDVINYSSNPKTSYEAKLRMLGIALDRKKEVNASDKELFSFFDQTPAEKKSMDKNLQKLLWLVKLRTKINFSEYEEALAYLQVIPVETFKPSERRTFEGDGAEAVLGRILQAYKENNFSRSVKTWEVFKDKYEDKVAKNPYLNFIVCDSYIKLGLFDSYERAAKELKSQKGAPIRTFPRWVEVNKDYDVESLLVELELSKQVKSEKWADANMTLAKIAEKNYQKVNYNFYKGLISFKVSKYTDAVTSFERVFLSSEEVDQLTAAQTTQMLSSYAESLYQLDDTKKFQKNAAAILQDLNRFKSEEVAEVKERLHYLLIESFAAESNTNYSRIEKLAQEFTNNFQKSSYQDRVKYLLGISMIKTNKENEGKEVLKNLVNAESTPGYLKDMARSELAAMELATKRI